MNLWASEARHVLAAWSRAMMRDAPGVTVTPSALEAPRQGTAFEGVLEANLDKLRKRHPEAFVHEREAR